MLSTPTIAALATSAAVVAAASTLTIASLSPESQLFGHTLIAGNDPNEIALTYDDGPNDAATLDLLNLLAKHNARATFFMIGRWVRQRPDIARAVHAAGHLVGNHTMNHPWLNTKPASLIREELRTCNEALEDTLGIPIRYFRAPHGARRPVVLRAAKELGLTAVQWNVMGMDWQLIGPDAIEAHVQKGLTRTRARHRGANILLHDGFDQRMSTNRADTLTVTDRLLAQFAQQGSHPVTVDAWT